MKNIKRFFVGFMALVVFLSSVLSASAWSITDNSDVVSLTWSEKIDDSVWEAIEEANNTEKISVWVWFADVDISQVESMIEKETGLTKNDLSVNSNVSTDKLIKSLEEVAIDGCAANEAEFNREMESYLAETKEERELARERTCLYLNAKRSIISELYTDNNNNLLDELNIDDSDIIFQSTLTSSAILNLTGEEIIELAQEDVVVSVDYYDDTEYLEPVQDNEQDTMQVDAVKNMYSLSGDGVNVLMNDGDYVRSDVDGYDNLETPSNIEVIKNGNIYTTTEIANISSASSNHAVHVASVLQGYAKDTHIYSTSFGRYADIEWALQNCNVDLINASVNYGMSRCNTYNSQAKWFDALVSTYSVTLVASAGNSYSWSSTNWPYVISPASSYNSIAVGSYSTNGNSNLDQMKDFRYGPIESSELPCYKPDVVIASPDTSTAAPALSGIISMMIQLEPSLSSQPEVIKAILMASCHRKVKPISSDNQENMSDGLTQKQGAGAVDAYRAIQIVLEGTYGFKTIYNSETASVTSFALPEIDNVNVSVAWNRKNAITGVASATLGDLNELQLEVYSGTILIKDSRKANAGKQVVYLQSLIPNTSYNVKIRRVSNNAESIIYGYAWSKEKYTHAEVELEGINAVGKSLNAELSYIDGKPVESDVSYTWKRSVDGVSWSNIPNANSNIYTLTEEDFLKYIRCEAVLNDNVFSNSNHICANTDTKIVKFGDVDMDGTVSTIDVSDIQRYLIKLIEFSEEQKIAGDVDGDGGVTAMDVTCIQMYLARHIDKFPIEE